MRRATASCSFLRLAAAPADSGALPAAGTSALPGEIVDVTYFGDRLECAVQIDGAQNQVVTVVTGKTKTLARKDRVALLFDGGRVTLWPS